MKRRGKTATGGADVPAKPTRAELLAAADKKVADVIAPGLKVLFVGINPGLYSAAIGRHFGRPGNRFWPAVHAGGFTPRVLKPWENEELLALGYGITNIVERASARADELSRDELRAGAKVLEAKLRKYRPKYAAILGVTAYRDAFARPRAVVGLQEETVGATKLWVLPNPSGLNAHWQADGLAQVFRALRNASEA